MVQGQFCSVKKKGGLEKGSQCTCFRCFMVRMATGRYCILANTQKAATRSCAVAAVVSTLIQILPLSWISPQLTLKTIEADTEGRKQAALVFCPLPSLFRSSETNVVLRVLLSCRTNNQLYLPQTYTSPYYFM